MSCPSQEMEEEEKWAFSKCESFPFVMSSFLETEATIWTNLPFFLTPALQTANNYPHFLKSRWEENQGVTLRPSITLSTSPLLHGSPSPSCPEGPIVCCSFLLMIWWWLRWEKALPSIWSSTSLVEWEKKLLVGDPQRPFVLNKWEVPKSCPEFDTRVESSESQ